MAHFNVHSPYQGKPDLVRKYDEKASKIPESKQRHPTMGAMIQSLDESIGKVNDKLKELGLQDNTIIIVMGDNGGVDWANDRKGDYKGIPITSNYPLRAGKACFYEGGVRVPLLIKYPKVTKAGAIESTPVHLIDFYPTLLNYAKIQPSKEKDVIDGVNIRSLIEQKGTIEKRPLFCHFPRTKQLGAPVGGSFVRYGDYKLCRLYGLNDDASDAYELYNLKYDIRESKDSIQHLPEVTTKLKGMLNDWLKETKALVPHPNPNFVVNN
jgi:arylsulfatase A-like enzyme